MLFFANPLTQFINSKNNFPKEGFQEKKYKVKEERSKKGKVHRQIRLLSTKNKIVTQL
jgi:hypothetical protein